MGVGLDFIPIIILKGKMNIEKRIELAIERGNKKINLKAAEATVLIHQRAEILKAEFQLKERIMTIRMEQIKQKIERWTD